MDYTMDQKWTTTWNRNVIHNGAEMEYTNGTDMDYKMEPKWNTQLNRNGIQIEQTWNTQWTDMEQTWNTKWNRHENTKMEQTCHTQ